MPDSEENPLDGGKDPEPQEPPVSPCADATSEEDESSEAEEPQNTSFPVVGIGASAGGLEAFEKLFGNMPSDAGMAFVVVQHLDPSRKSLLSELLGRQTEMQVVEAEDGMTVRPNSVYTIPPNRNIALRGNKLYLFDLPSGHVQRTPIDYFFRSLAENQRQRALGILLSGSGNEGVIGMRSIRAEGGVTFAQDPETAKYPSMPINAINANVVDFVLAPEQMPARLVELGEGRVSPNAEKQRPPAEKEKTILPRLFHIVRNRTGHDFSYYKEKTIRRRIDRRMMVNQIVQPEHYLSYLQRNSDEVEALFNDLLIGVTSFFRDPKVFEALEERVMANLFQPEQNKAEVRIWAPGCASGEEAYTIAILAQEAMDKTQSRVNVQIFATDIDEEAIARARVGWYPEGIAADITPQRLKRNFREEGNGWRVKDQLRDMVVFAIQNVVSDPPFSRLDLVSCRNLLIYMKHSIQQKLMPLFHYALRQGGYLFLGTSESTGDFPELFKPVDPQARIFQRRDVATVSHVNELSFPFGKKDQRQPDQTSRRQAQEDAKQSDFHRLTHTAVMEELGVVSVLVDDAGKAVYFDGPTDRYFKTPMGSPTWEITSLAREGLKGRLGPTMHRALREKAVVYRNGLKVKRNGETLGADLMVKPILNQAGMENWLLLVLTEADIPQETGNKNAGASKDQSRDEEVQELQQELSATKQRLQATIEELETSNEELKSTNEELQSSNEELQSTNEELSTAKEEQQSVNEELSTVNAELQQKVQELSTANDDMNNLLAATQIGTVFLDSDLKIQRFTPTAMKVVALIESDVGRPFGDITTRTNYTRLEDDAREVIDTLQTKDLELDTTAGQRYLTRIRPYRTKYNVINGVVITFVDITEVHRARQATEDALEFAQAIVDTVRAPLLVLSSDLTVQSANPAFYRKFDTAPEKVEGKPFAELDEGQWDIPDLRDLLEKVLPEREEIVDYKLEHTFEKLGGRTLYLNARKLARKDQQPAQILLSMEDASGR